MKWRHLLVVAGIIVFLAFGIPVVVYRFQNPDMTQIRVFLNWLPWSIIAPIGGFLLVALGMWKE